MARGSPPVLSLPTEILVDILLQSNNPYIPLVCTDFRDVAYGTPSFWTYIYLGPKQRTPEALLFLNRRLERSVTWPLDVIIRSTGLTSVVTLELWERLSIERDRILTFDVETDTYLLCGLILNMALLPPPISSSLPLLQKLDIRHDENLHVPNLRAPMEPHALLRSIGTLFPVLTTLVLPLMLPCIPFPDSPILSLKTLVLDGSMTWCCDYPLITQIAQFLVQTPNLETLWCKEHRVFTFTDFTALNMFHQAHMDFPPVHFPVTLSRLTKLAVVVPGLGIDLLHAINAPALHDLHMDGIRDDYMLGDDVMWLDWFPEALRAGLQITALRSPELRRLSLLGVYLSRDTWEWLLRCGTPATEIPSFNFLDSIAVHQMRAVKDYVTNTMDDALINLYARQGHLTLLRFAYLASEPPLSSVALNQLIDSAVERKARDQIFELEVDGALDLESRNGARLILHKERPRRKSWWTLGKDIDPTENDSY